MPELPKGWTVTPAESPAANVAVVEIKVEPGIPLLLCNSCGKVLARATAGPPIDMNPFIEWLALSLHRMWCTVCARWIPSKSI